jgi:phosphoenolpyruvate-protein kinase (PTS system EI component)
MFYKKLLSESKINPSQWTALEIYRGEKYYFSTDTILNIETEQIRKVFNPGFVRNSERYTLGPDGWRNFITRLQTMNVHARRAANPEKPGEYAFSKFAEIDRNYKDTVRGQWMNIDEDTRWYQGLDGKVRFLEIPARTNPEQYLLFIVLGDIPQQGVPKLEWEESILLLQADNPFNLAVHSDLRQKIEDVRTTAYQAYKHSLEQGVIEIDLPKAYFGEKVVQGTAWIESELTQVDIENVPDHIKQKAVDHLQQAVKDSFQHYCRQQLFHLPDSMQSNVEDCVAKLLDTVDGAMSVSVSDILTRYFGEQLAEKEPLRVFAEISIFADINNKLLTELSNDKTPWEVINTLIQKNEERVAKIADVKIKEAMKIGLNYLLSIRKTFVYGEEQQIRKGSVVFGQDMSSTQIHNYVDHGAIPGAVSLGSSDQSHAYIVAEGLKFPLLVGLTPALMQYISRGAPVAFYGNKLLINATPERLADLNAETEKSNDLAKYFIRQFQKEAKLTAAGRPVRLRENAASNKNQQNNQQNYVDSIGLFRMEFELSDQKHVLNSQEWLAVFSTALAKHPGGITFRTLDEGRDKEPIDALPAMLPEQSLYEYVSLDENQTVRNAQIEYMRAIFMLATEHPEVQFEIIYPMIWSKAELDYYHAAFFVPLQKEFPQAKVREGAMIETHGAVASLEAILDAVDCVSIGSNDLAASVRGKKRSEVSNLDGLHPGVLETLRYIIQTANAENKPVEICGEIAGNPVIACILLALGQVDLSMNNENIPFVQAAGLYLEKQGLFPKITEILEQAAEQQMPNTELYNSVLELFQEDVFLYKLLKDRYSLN